MSLPTLTLGIEEEYQIIDPETRELAPYSEELIERGQVILGEQIKPELMRSQVEVGSKICRDVGEALRVAIVQVRELGLDHAGRDCIDTYPGCPLDGERLRDWIEEEVQQAAR